MSVKRFSFRPPVPLWLWPLMIVGPFVFCVACCLWNESYAGLSFWELRKAGLFFGLTTDEPADMSLFKAALKMGLILGVLASICCTGGLVVARRRYNGLFMRLVSSAYYAAVIFAVLAAVWGVAWFFSVAK